jgi:uncharacterized membrane protein YdfJ with MMPL/SSD domain
MTNSFFSEDRAGRLAREREALRGTLHLFHVTSSIDSKCGMTRRSASQDPAPARDQQFREMEDALPIVEAGTVLVILLVVGLTFRAFGAPLLTLFAAAISFLVARGVIPWVGTRLGVEIPQEVEPLVVA